TIVVSFPNISHFLFSADKQTSKKKDSSCNKNILRSQITGNRRSIKSIKLQGLPQKRTVAKERAIKFALEEFKKNNTKDHVTENVNYLLGFDNVANNDIVEKVLMQSRGRKARDQKLKREMIKQEKSTFSDADFKRFEKEYFGSK
uniref:Active regulator of SIRT1 n=1 Tax=Leptobrachium leishanense TaxID=445787 RepID=A0A8C5QDA5_9ANUR